MIDLNMQYFCNRVSHTKASLVGSSISIPITDGRLNLGTWQGTNTSTGACDLPDYFIIIRDLSHRI